MRRFLVSALESIFRRDAVTWLRKQGLRVGANFHMLHDVFIDPSHAWLVEIGNDVTLAPFVQIFAHDASTKMHLDKTRIGKVLIGDRVFVGASSIILPGVTIGSQVVIGAGSVVAGDVPSGMVVAGNPARVICSLAEFVERRNREVNESPSFGLEYTILGNITEDRKVEMNARMHSRIGYIV